MEQVAALTAQQNEVHRQQLVQQQELQMQVVEQMRQQNFFKWGEY